MPSVAIVPTNNSGSGYAGVDQAHSNGGTPPDTGGAAGPTSYVETVNQTLAIFSPKASGAVKTADTFEHFWTNTGGLSRADSGSILSDCFVLYDDNMPGLTPTTGRFVVGDLDTDPTTDASVFDIAVSKSASPATLTTADWNFYQIKTTESGYLTDYPGNPGYNHDAFVFTLNMLGANSQTQVVSLNAADLANGVSQSSLHYYQTNLGGTDYRPTAMHDAAAGAPMWLLTEHGDLQSIDVVKETNVLSTSPGFSFTNIAVTPYSQTRAPLNPDGSEITTDTTSLIQKAAEANNTIVAAHSVSVSTTEDDVQWYAVSVSSGTPTLLQEGRVSAGNGTYLTYPAIDINASGTIGMTYLRSGTDSPSDFESMYVTGRAGSDASGTMEASVRVPAGTGQKDLLGGRAGDLSGIGIDPSDGSFWAANEFADTATSQNWGTAIANFTVSNPPTPTPVSNPSIPTTISNPPTPFAVSNPPTPGVAISAGGTAAGPYITDSYFSGGTNDSTTSTISTSGVTDAAPQAVYQSERYGSSFIYTIHGLAVDAPYIVRLHETEFYWHAAGKREFDVSANGTTELTNYDIYARAGGADIAIVPSFTITASSTGTITLVFTAVVDNAKVDGIEILPGTAINAGGSAAGAYIADTSYFSRGTNDSTTSTISTSGVTDPALQAVYQTERYGGSLTDTIPGLTAGPGSGGDATRPIMNVEAGTPAKFGPVGDAESLGNDGLRSFVPKSTWRLPWLSAARLYSLRLPDLRMALMKLLE